LVCNLQSLPTSNSTKEVLESKLEDTEESCDWLETQFSRIKDIGIQPYLAEHMHD